MSSSRMFSISRNTRGRHRKAPGLSTLPRKDTEPFPVRSFIFPCFSVCFRGQLYFIYWWNCLS